MKNIILLAFTLLLFGSAKAQTDTKPKKQEDVLKNSQERRSDSGRKDYLKVTMKEVLIAKKKKAIAVPNKRK